MNINMANKKNHNVVKKKHFQQLFHPWRDAASTMLHLAAPVQYTATKCGSYISKSQPDVELLAVALDDIPHSSAEFDAKRGARDFIVCKFLVLSIGPAGFGKVPYKHKNKAKKLGSEEEVGKSLYETMDSGLVKLYAYEKGDTNKDKGVRCDDCFGVLAPGLCLTFFLREEMFQPTKMMADSLISKLQYVCLQVASGNVTGASVGYLLKLKKIKAIPPPQDLMHALTKLPQTEEAYEALMEQYRSTYYTTMKGGISDKLDTKYCVVSSMGRDVFADHEVDEGFLICNAAINNKEGFTDEIVVRESLVLSCFDTTCVQTALRLLNIALAMDAVCLILQTAPETTIALNEDRPTAPNTALCMLCDYNKLLFFDALTQAGALAWVQDEMRSFSHNFPEEMKVSTVMGNMQLELAKEKDSEFSTFTYCCTDVVYKDHLNCSNHIYVRIHEKVLLHDSPKFVCTTTDPAAKFISHARPGPCNAVDIMLKQQSSASPPKTILTLQMRRGAMSSVGSKRKRPNILEVMDDFTYTCVSAQ